MTNQPLTVTIELEEGQTKQSNPEYAANRLKGLIERIENLEDEKSVASMEIAEIYKEAKGLGFNPKIMRAIIHMRKIPIEDRREEEALIDLYAQALGMEQ